MKKFEESRTHVESLHTNKYPYPIPIITFSPNVETEKTVVFIFATGLGGTFPFFKILNHPFFDNHYLICYEKMAHGENKNKAQRLPRCFVNELDCIVNYAKIKFPNKKIYLLGESWGTALSMIYYQKHPTKINGLFGWSMPWNIKDPGHKPWLQRLNIFFKMLLTMPFGIQTWDYHPKDSSEVLSSNTILVRTIKASNKNLPGNNKLAVASWWSFKPAWRILKRSLNNPSMNFAYIQSGEDYMLNKKHYDKIKQLDNSNKMVWLDRGFHILSMEEPYNDDLYKIIAEHL